MVGSTDTERGKRGKHKLLKNWSSFPLNDQKQKDYEAEESDDSGERTNEQRIPKGKGGWLHSSLETSLSQKESERDF